MKKYLIALSLLVFSGCLLANPIIALPTDELSSYIPTPINITLPKNSSNIDLKLTNGGISVLSVKSFGNIAIAKVSTRFRAVDKLVKVVLTTNGISAGESTGFINLKDVVKTPFDAGQERVLIAGTEYIFVKGGKELLEKSSNGNIRFFVKNAVSQNSYIKKVDIELTNGSEKSILTIEGSALWWHPYMSIDGDFTGARILDVQLN